MEIKHLKINRKRYSLRNYGDGWDIYYIAGSEGLELVEEGVSSFQEAKHIAELHSKGEY